MTSHHSQDTSDLNQERESFLEEKEEGNDHILAASKTAATTDDSDNNLPSKSNLTNAQDKATDVINSVHQCVESNTSNQKSSTREQADIVKESSGDIKKRLHPFVHWAQSPTHISLRVDLVQVENLDVKLDDEGLSLKFFAQGKGAHGLQEYYFSINFFAKVENKFDCHAIERYVLILLKKNQQQVRWPRLAAQSTKLAWLRIDFDRYSNEYSDSESDQEDADDELDKGKREFLELQEQLRQAKEKQPTEDQEQSNNSWSKSLNNIFNNTSKKNSDIFNPFNRKISSSKKVKFGETTNMKYDYRKDDAKHDKGKNSNRKGLDYKKTYLFLYNLMMFVMFLKVYIVLVLKTSTGTVDDDIVKSAALIIKWLTYTQLLETVHPILGLVPGGPLMPFTQVVGRLLVNHFISEPTIRIDSAPYTNYLFIVWSSIELFRYSFYALRVFKVDIYPITWCRYTLFLPLYPMGGFCESMVLISTIKFYEKTGQYSLSLPNSANISFSLPFALRVYIFVLLGPTIYSLMKYMWRQRCKQLKA